MHARDQTKMERLLGGHADAPREFRRIDLADDVGEFRAGSKSFGISLLARPPTNRHLLLTMTSHKLPRHTTQRSIRILVEWHAGNIEERYFRIEKTHQRSH